MRSGDKSVADDVDARAERAADAARSAVKRPHRASSNLLLPMLVMILSVLSVALLVMTDKDAPQPAQPRVEASSTTQPGN